MPVSKPEQRFLRQYFNFLQISPNLLWIFTIHLKSLEFIPEKVTASDPIHGGRFIGHRVKRDFEKVDLFAIVFRQKPRKFVSVGWSQVQNIILHLATQSINARFFGWASLRHCQLHSCAPFTETHQIFGGETEVIGGCGLQIFQDVEARRTLKNI